MYWFPFHDVGESADDIFKSGIQRMPFAVLNAKIEHGFDFLPFLAVCCPSQLPAIPDEYMVWIGDCIPSILVAHAENWALNHRNASSTANLCSVHSSASGRCTLLLHLYLSLNYLPCFFWETYWTMINVTAVWKYLILISEIRVFIFRIQFHRGPRELA